MPFFDITNLKVTEVIPGYKARSIHTGSMTFLYWTVTAGASMPVHSHVHEQVSHVLSGIFELTVGDEKNELAPGRIAVIPPNVPHGGIAKKDCQLHDVFLPERDDYKFS
jgi:quercetin dioxygenase-like cupin family protein